MTWIKKHHPCPMCDSSDAACTDSSGKIYCFSCKGTAGGERPSQPRTERVSTTDTWELFLQSWEANQGKPIDDRLLTTATTKKYGVSVVRDDHIYPYHDEYGLASLKRRTPEKKFPTAHRDESVEPSKLKLFGQQAFPEGGKYIIVTEGECDAMAAYEMFGRKHPAVSVRSSSTALADVQANYHYLDSYATVVFMFDPDPAGDKAVQECANVFAGKSKIASLNPEVGDPCEYLKLGYEVEFKNAFWEAKKYTPAGLVEGVDLWDLINQPAPQPVMSFPWPMLNAMMHGVFEAALYTVCAGSGVGKTTLVKMLEYHVLQTTDKKLALMHLEEDLARTTRGLMTQHLQKPLHLPECVTTEEERRKAFDATMGSGRVICYDHFGSTHIDEVLATLRYSNRVFGAQIMVVDHLHIMLSSMDNPDERKAIDEVMTKLRILVQELGITLFLVSHLSRPHTGLAHEEGREVTPNDLRGSQSIYQLSDGVIAAERNALSDDPIERNTTVLRGIKNRLAGELGKADSLFYNNTTGCLTVNR